MGDLASKDGTILVVGASGFIGRHLIFSLSQKGYKVVGIDLVKPDWIDDSVVFYTGDYSLPSFLGSIEEKIDVVFHLASSTLPKTSNDNPRYDVSSNLIATLGLLDWSVENKIKKFIFLSSGGTIYGAPENLPVTEDQPTNPLCSYGIVKLAIEKYLHLYDHLYGLQSCSLRLANPYGENQRVDTAQGVIAVFCDKALKGDVINIWGDGEVTRDFIYIGDAVEAIIKSIYVSGQVKEINIGSGYGVSVNRIIDIIEKGLDQKIKRNYLPSRKFDVPDIYIDISRASKYLDWTPSIEIEDGVKKVLDWMRK